MIWQAKEDPPIGTVRTIRRFAIWPVRIGRDVVWLARFEEKQRRDWTGSTRVPGGGYSPGMLRPGWVPTARRVWAAFKEWVPCP